MTAQFFDGFGDVAVPGPRGAVGDITPEAEAARAEVVRAREDVAADTLAAEASATQAAEALAEMRLVAGSDEVVEAIADAASAKAAASTASTDASSALTQLTTQRLVKIVPGRTNPMAVGGTGLVPPAGSRFIIQAGSAVATTNAAGDFYFDWPEAFPTAILSVQLTPGDAAASAGAIALRSATTLTTCHAYAPVSSGGTRCDYLAIGY